MSQPRHGATAGLDDFQSQLAEAAADRAATWEAVADVLDAPAPARTERLRAGEQASVWLRHCQWLGQDADLLATPVTTLRTYARAARRRDAAADHAALLADHQALVGPVAAGVCRSARQVAELCRAEASAWSAGDVPRGRELRSQQRAILDEDLVPRLVPLGTRLATEASARVWRSLGRTLLAVASIETGTDHTLAEPAH